MLLLPKVNGGSSIATFPKKILPLFNKNTRITLTLISLAILSYFGYSYYFSRRILSLLPKNNKNDPNTAFVNNPCKYNQTQGPRILCTIFTTSGSHSTRMKAIHDTWSSRGCHKRLYMTGPKVAGQADDPNMPFVYMNIVDTKEQLTNKHMGVVMHVYKNYLNNFDWFLYANDDTYIVMENLKLFLFDKCPIEKSLYGHVMRHLPNEPVNNYGDWQRGYIQGTIKNLILTKFLK